MRAKFGIKNTQNAGVIGMLLRGVRASSAQPGKVSDWAGIGRNYSIDLPKLDVAGSTPVARSNILKNQRRVDILIRA
jgi:hypothetical protein